MEDTKYGDITPYTIKPLESRSLGAQIQEFCVFVNCCCKPGPVEDKGLKQDS